MVKLIYVVVAHLTVEQVNCKGNGVTICEISLVFLLVNLVMFVTWIWFSVAVRRKLG